MIKEWTENKKFGLMPFNELTKLLIQLDLPDKNETISLQYELLLDDAIIRAHLEKSQNSAVIILNEKSLSKEGVLKKLSKFNPMILEEKKVKFEDLLEKAVNF